jgi:hypothetical protein
MSTRSTTPPSIVTEARGIIGPGDGAKPREILVQID